MKSKLTIDPYGNKEWRNSAGYLHRFTGPARIWKSGVKEWFINGLYHRLNGPAVIAPAGNTYWIKEHKEWHLNGVLYIETI